MPVFLGAIQHGGLKAQGAADPVASDDLATKGYVVGNFQPADADLTAFAALAASADGSFLGRSGGAYAMRSAANTKTDLSLNRVLNILHNITATTAPGTGNDNTQGYSVGSLWFNTSTHLAYYCADASTGAALWVKINFISSVASPLVESGGGLTIPVAAGPSTDGYMSGSQAALVGQLATASAWIAPTLGTNWSNFGGIWQTAGYRKDALGRVYLRGMIKKSIAVVGGETLFTTAAGSRPTADEYFVVNSNGAFGTVFVAPDGTVNLQVGNATYVSLSGISFDTI